MNTQLVPLGKGISARIINIDPDHAKKMLERNTINRPLVSGKVSEYAIDMREGYWNWNGVPILISDKGNLMDGQHRLSAVIESGMSFEFLLIVGVPESSFTTIDTGKNRSGKDILYINGLSKHKAGRLSKLIKRTIAYKEGRHLTRAKIGEDYSQDRYSKRTRYNNKMILDEYSSNMYYYDDIYNKYFTERIEDQKSISYHARKLYIDSDIFYYYSVFYNIHTEDAYEFIKKLCTGYGLSAGSPILYTRGLLNDIKTDDKKTITYKTLTILMYKTWNAFRLKQNISKFQLHENQNIPKLI